MMFNIFFSVLLFGFSMANTNEDVLSEEFCRQFPSLHLCRLHDTLQLQYLLQDTEAQMAATSSPMEKRKSAFVRFGKRSGIDSLDMEKRKSAFVRFGRSADMEKRKSQYIRFGRK
ncbi:unnamed protein product [Auanema sp. JU1783]|nr:unnamed protein product [Auanema sp. JU1783]